MTVCSWKEPRENGGEFGTKLEASSKTGSQPGAKQRSPRLNERGSVSCILPPAWRLTGNSCTGDETSPPCQHSWCQIPLSICSRLGRIETGLLSLHRPTHPAQTGRLETPSLPAIKLTSELAKVACHRQREQRPGPRGLCPGAAPMLWACRGSRLGQGSGMEGGPKRGSNMKPAWSWTASGKGRCGRGSERTPPAGSTLDSARGWAQPGFSTTDRAPGGRLFRPGPAAWTGG